MTNRRLEELEKKYLSDSSVKEFDTLMQKGRTRILTRRVLTFAASALVLVGLAGAIGTFSRKETYNDVSTLEILEAINTLANTKMEEVKSITAVPGKNGIIVTADYKTGKSVSYLLRKDEEGSSFQLTAMN